MWKTKTLFLILAMSLLIPSIVYAKDAKAFNLTANSISVTLPAYDDGTLCFWGNRTATSDTIQLQIGDGTDTMIQMHSNGNIYWRRGPGGTNFINPTELNQWDHYCIIWNQSAESPVFYINSTFKQLGSSGAASPAGTWTFNSGSNIQIDEFVIFNRSLKVSELQDLYNLGTGLYVNKDNTLTSTGATIGDNVTVIWHLDEGSGTLINDNSTIGDNDGTASGAAWVTGLVDIGSSPILPLSGNITFFDNITNISTPRQNYPVMFNVSINVSGTQNISWVTFSWDNGSNFFVNDTPIKIDIATNSTHVSVNKTIFNSSGAVVQWIWYANVTNGTQNNNGIEHLTVAGFDAPNVTINGNNFFNANNKSIISLNQSQKVLLNLSFMDDIDAFAFNINITQPNGSVVYNLTYISLSGTIANYTAFINVSGPQGFYNTTIEVSDSHTAKSIPDFEIDKGLSYLKYDDTITIEAEGAIWSSTEKFTDRYNFKFNYLPFVAPKTKVFYIESENNLDLINSSEYKAHFVDYKANKWIDFEGIEGQPTITKISEKRYKIEFEHEGSSITFKSIGGLNRNVFQYQYYLSNVSVDWLIPDTSVKDFIGSSVAVSLNVTGNGRNLTKFYLYNSSNDEVQTINVSNNGTGEYFYNATFSGLTDTTYRLNATHIDINNENSTSTTVTLNLIKLTNCGAGYPSINFTLKDEQNSSLVRGDTTGSFTFNGTSKVHTYSVSEQNKNNFSVCITPANQQLIADYTLNYEATGYPQRSLTVTDITLSNATQNKNLFLLKTEEGIYATFRVIDAFQNPLASVSTTIKIASSNTTIETRNTDDSGVVSFFVNPDTTYLYTFTKSGFTTLETTLRITTTDIITVVLESGASEQVTSFATGINYFFEPSNMLLNNNTEYSFVFNLTSTNWNITDCTLRLRNESQLLTQSSCQYNGSKANSSISFNTGNQSVIISEAEYQLNGTNNYTSSQNYKVQWNYKGQFSLKNALDDITSFSAGAFNDFGRFLIGVLIILLIVGGLSLQSTDFREPEILIPITWILVGVFSYIGWFNIPLDSLPDVRGLPPDWLNKWILFVLISLTGGAYLGRKHLT